MILRRVYLQQCCPKFRGGDYLRRSVNQTIVLVQIDKLVRSQKGGNMAKSKSPNFYTKHPAFKKFLLVGLAVTFISIIMGFIPDLNIQVFGMIGVWIGFLIILLGVNTLIADLAVSKGRNWQAFFWLSVLFSPLIMWIIAATISPLPGSSAYVAPSTPLTTTKSSDVAQEIEKLGSLRSQGLITKAEFDSKKKDLLDRM